MNSWYVKAVQQSTHHAIGCLWLELVSLPLATRSQVPVLLPGSAALPELCAK